MNDTTYQPQLPFDETKYCQCGCGQPLASPKFPSQQRRYLRGHYNKVHIKPVAQRFWEKVDKSAPDDCWHWTGSRNDSGYGQITLTNPRKYLRAHRVSWELHFGPIPDGMFVCHKCDNPPCCNPAHLFLGTQLDNLRDMQDKGRKGTYDRSGERNSHAKLTEEQVMAIRQRVEEGASQAAMDRLYCIAPGTTGQIVRRRTWKHV